MKSTGVVRRFDDLGRIVIPKEIRKNCLVKQKVDMEWVRVSLWKYF